MAAEPMLYQIQDGTPSLIMYASKRLHQQYSITELDLLGLSIQILDAKVYFDCTVSHSALTYFMKIKFKLPVQQLNDC